MIGADWLKARVLPVATLLLVAALIFAGVQTYRVGALKAVVADIEKKLKGVREEYAVFRARIVDRTADALLADRANAQSAVAAQVQITEERTDAYRSRIDALSARVAGLREQSRGGVSGGRGSASVPATSATASGVDGAARGDGFSLELRAAATAQAIRLDELQKWVRQQGQVDNSGTSDPPPDNSDGTVAESDLKHPFSGP